MIDAEGIIEEVGAAIPEMFGYDEAELIGQNVKMLMVSFHARQHDAYLKAYRETGKRNIIGLTRVENARHKDGHLFSIELSVGEASAEGETHFLGFIRELTSEETNRRQVQTMLADLSHSTRVSAMATLATSIAHELNQPLTTITNYTEGVRDMLRDHTEIEGIDEIVDVLDKCGQQAVRAGQLLQRMRDFMSHGRAQREAVSLNQLIDHSISLALMSAQRLKVKIDVSIPTDLPEIMINPLQGQQVLFNLIRNGFEAIQNQGERPAAITISARLAEDGFVEIRVEDSGPGIKADMRDVMFDSFVTSKIEGMGVGLAICRQIVEANGGRIWPEVSRELGGAAMCFTAPLPVANAVD